MNRPELLVYVLRPDNTALWLPERVARTIEAKHGDKLSAWQFESRAVSDVIAERGKKPK